MREINLQELKQIQLDIMKYFDSFCKNNGLKYSLAGGSLIGAVRHDGYIPWDDDIDVIMLRGDYDKMLEIFNKNECDYKVFTPQNCAYYCLPYAKIANTKTVLQENSSAFSGKDFGINIDVFPVENLPKGDGDIEALYKKIRKLRDIHDVKMINISSSRSFVKNLALIFLKIGAVCFNKHKIAAKISNAITVYKDTTPAKRACLLGMYGRREILDADVFENTVPHKFEDTQFEIFEKYDAYLSSLYGDYMKLPPKEKQVSHHSFKAYWL